MAGHMALSAYARGGSAVSPEAQRVRQAAHAVAELVEKSHALFGDKAAALSQLRTLAAKCATEGWDGGDAAALSPMAVLMAEWFVQALPDNLPLPEFAPEPDGGLSLDWIKSRHQIFSISLGDTHRMAYNWVDGADRGYATAIFIGHQIPERVLEGIRAITKCANANLKNAGVGDTEIPREPEMHSHGNTAIQLA